MMGELFSVKLHQGLLQNTKSYLSITYNSVYIINYLFLSVKVLLGVMNYVSSNNVKYLSIN